MNFGRFYAESPVLGFYVGTDVLGYRLALALEFAVRRNVESLPRRKFLPLGLARQDGRQFTRRHFHYLGVCGAELVLAGEYHAGRFSRPVGHVEGETEPPPLVVDVGLGNKFHVFKLFSSTHNSSSYVFIESTFISVRIF